MAKRNRHEVAAGLFAGELRRIARLARRAPATVTLSVRVGGDRVGLRRAANAVDLRRLADILETYDE